MTERRWYVVNTKYGQESVANEHLKNQNFAVFYPQIQERYLKKGLRFIRNKPLYPTYLFVELDIAKDPWYKIKSTRGVQGILGSSPDSALPVRRGFIEKLISGTQDGVIPVADNTTRHSFKPGQTVVINALNFNGLTAVVERLKKNNKILLKTSLLHREISLILEANLISPLPEPDSAGVR